jgi:hypothetical protein
LIVEDMNAKAKDCEPYACGEVAAQLEVAA